MLNIKEISAKDASKKLKNENAVLIDVRSEAEFAFVGVAAIEGKMILLPWKIFPNMSLNGRFQINLEKKLEEFFGEDAKNAELIFMCRSGARSFEAASYMANFGYENCYNLTNGFEGDLDVDGHRGNVNGWKAEGLVWKQQ